MTMKKCSDCNFCLIKEYGYSNYTVEGADVYCTLGLNPEAPFDRWYGEDKRDLFAETCPDFNSTYGPVVIDAEEEEVSRKPRKDGEYWSERKDGPDKWENYETPHISRYKIAEICE
jgi:hypothetical protein